MTKTTTMAGHVHVWGGGLDEVNFCHVDSYGNFDAGPEISDQDEIEEAIQQGAASGETEAGHCWRYADKRATSRIVTDED